SFEIPMEEEKGSAIQRLIQRLDLVSVPNLLNEINF
ncbi:hypothetical protein LEP1GSC024_2712, partial [Leptospira noguchii str. 2001034031]